MEQEWSFLRLDLGLEFPKIYEATLIRPQYKRDRFLSARIESVQGDH